jgi:hypothetical protein
MAVQFVLLGQALSPARGAWAGSACLTMARNRWIAPFGSNVY